VHPSTKALWNLRNSCEQPVQMVVWSTMVWLAGGQASQKHLTTHSARPVVGRGQGPSVVTRTHAQDPGRA